MKVLIFLEFGKKGGGIYCFLVWFGLVLDWGEVGVELDFLFLFLKHWGSLLRTFNPPKAQKDEFYPPYNPQKKNLYQPPMVLPLRARLWCKN
jgi:hypothetical protein